MAKSASQLIFDQNKSLILNAIRDKGPISRIELTRVTGISAPTVTRIVSSLISDHLVRNTGLGNSSGGRPPVILEFDTESCFVIGIEWGFTHIRGVLSNLNGDIRIEKNIKIDLSAGFDEALESLYDLIADLQNRSMLSSKRLKGIGISAAGYINKKTGNIEFSPVQKWQNINIKEPLETRFNVPVYIDHQSRVLALCEHLYGRAKEIKDLLFINVDYGMGAGILVDGLVMQGFDGFSGEMGHIHISPPDGYGERICLCGKKNCLAEFVSGRGIGETAALFLKDNSDSLLASMIEGDTDSVSAKLVSKAAEEGDSFCGQILQDAGEILGITIANMTNILNPEAVLLGGKLAKSDYYFSIIEKSFNENRLRGSARAISLIRSNMINQAAVKGAAALVLQNILNFS